jgi:predicted acetyltransferase
MLRLLDAQRFLAARGYRRGAMAEFAFALDDPRFAANTRPFVLTVDRGRGRVHAGGSGSIRADVASFARLCTGAASATELAREGSLAASATELERLDALFALPPAMLQSLP